MHIKINNLNEGTHLYTISEPIENVGLTEPFFDELKLNLILEKVHNQLILETKFKVRAHFECDRCMEEFDSNLESNYKIIYLFGNQTTENDEAVNVTYLPLDTSEIVLDNDIRDYAILSIPMKKLCKEDCLGLCPTCGKNLNEGLCNCNSVFQDLRWKKLEELKKKIDNN